MDFSNTTTTTYSWGCVLVIEINLNIDRNIGAGGQPRFNLVEAVSGK
jgi:hypothetical protein